MGQIDEKCVQSASAATTEEAILAAAEIGCPVIVRCSIVGSVADFGDFFFFCGQNFDPLGIHTGDPIVVAPSKTLSDVGRNMPRTTTVDVIYYLGVVDERNIQYTLSPTLRLHPAFF
jgi:carbamoylphosphate synthase large subunit